MVYPKESEWFQQLDSNYRLQPLEESDFYKQDYIGLRYLNEAGKVQFKEVDGDHLDTGIFETLDIFIPFLNSTETKPTEDEPTK